MMNRPLRIAVLRDPVDEGWKAMDLVGEMLTDEWKGAFADKVSPTSVDVKIPRLARRVRLGDERARFNADRLAARFLRYPAHALGLRGKHDFFHVVDHTYAHLVCALPSARTGVYCHDLDAFRSLLDPDRDPRPAWFRTLARIVLRGMQSAAIVFHSTLAVRREIERHQLVDPGRLVHAPYGVSNDFDAAVDNDDGAVEALGPIAGRPFLLHVGSSLPRKRLDVLFELFARLRAHHPDLRLVQNGAELTASHRAHIDRLAIGGALFQPASRHIERRTLAGIYRRAAAVLVTSDAEGFGLPVIEALACGAVVVASDIPVLREVGGEAALYAPVGDAAAWVGVVDGVMGGDRVPPPRELRIARAARYRWREHARVILDAYRSLA